MSHCHSSSLLLHLITHEPGVESDTWALNASPLLELVTHPAMGKLSGLPFHLSLGADGIRVWRRARDGGSGAGLEFRSGFGLGDRGFRVSVFRFVDSGISVR